MKKLTVLVLSLLIIISLGIGYKTINANNETLYTYEDFRITEVSSTGEIRGEKIQGTGEGIFLIQSDLHNIPGSPTHLTVDDKIQVAWTTHDYENSIWDDIQSIKLIN